jgi:hypothetical protein
VGKLGTRLRLVYPSTVSAQMQLRRSLIPDANFFKLAAQLSTMRLGISMMPQHPRLMANRSMSRNQASRKKRTVRSSSEPKTANAERSPKDALKVLSLRMPEALHVRLQRAAAQEERPINRQIIKVLKDWLDGRNLEVNGEDEEDG